MYPYRDAYDGQVCLVRFFDAAICLRATDIEEVEPLASHIIGEVYEQHGYYVVVFGTRMDEQEFHGMAVPKSWTLEIRELEVKDDQT